MVFGASAYKYVNGMKNKNWNVCENKNNSESSEILIQFLVLEVVIPAEQSSHTKLLPDLVKWERHQFSEQWNHVYR